MPRPTDRRLRVLVADDHPSVRENLRYLVNAEYDMECVAVAPNGLRCLELARVLEPDVLVVDEEMPGASGLQVLQFLRRELPDIKVVMYTLDGEVCEIARPYGAAGCVTKDAHYEVLLRTIRAAAAAQVPSKGWRVAPSA